MVPTRTRPGDTGTGWADGADEALDKWLQKYRTVPPPDAAAIAQEETRHLEAALARLPKTQQLIVRRKLEGIKGTDIAKEIGKSQAYVSQAYHEGLEVIRDAIEV